MSEIKLVISEVDGVLTGGQSPIDELGNIPFKHFYMDDFDAVNEIKRKGVPVVFLSSDNHINYHLMRSKNIPFYWAPKPKDKRTTAYDILRRYSVSAEEVLFVGSRFSDFKCTQVFPNSACPADASPSVRKWSAYTLEAKSGRGVLVEVFFRYFSK